MFQRHLDRRTVRFSPLLLLGLASCMSDKPGIDLFPLYRNVADAESSELSVLWPLSSFESSTAGGVASERSWVFPFHLHSQRGAHDELRMVPMLPPIWFHQRSLDLDALQAFPVYDRVQSGAMVDHSILLFLGQWSRYAGEDELQTLAIQPLFQWEQKGRGDRLRLLSVGRNRSDTPLLALFSRDRSGIGLYGEADRDATGVDVLSAGWGLLNLFHADGAGSHDDLRVLTLFDNEPWSLFERRVPHEGAPGADGGRTVLFPFYWNVYDSETRFAGVWPPYLQRTRAGEVIERSFLFPLLRTVDDPTEQRSGVDVLFPLFGRHDTAGRRHTWLFPLFDVESTDEWYRWSTLLYAFGFGSDGEKRELRLLWFPIQW